MIHTYIYIFKKHFYYLYKKLYTAKLNENECVLFALNNEVFTLTVFLFRSKDIFNIIILQHSLLLTFLKHKF